MDYDEYSSIDVYRCIQFVAFLGLLGPRSPRTTPPARGWHKPKAQVGPGPRQSAFGCLDPLLSHPILGSRTVLLFQPSVAGFSTSSDLSRPGSVQKHVPVLLGSLECATAQTAAKYFHQSVVHAPGVDFPIDCSCSNCCTPCPCHSGA